MRIIFRNLSEETTIVLHSHLLIGGESTAALLTPKFVFFGLVVFVFASVDNGLEGTRGNTAKALVFSLLRS